MKKCLIKLFILIALPVMAVPEQAPSFALSNNRGKIIYKSSLHGNLLISFFASYCRPCAKEIPQLAKLERTYGKQKNLSLVLIAVDINDEDGEANEKAGRFLKTIGVDHDYLLDIYQVVFSKFSSKKEIPSTFLVNQAGHILIKEIGTRENPILRLKKAILDLL